MANKPPKKATDTMDEECCVINGRPHLPPELEEQLGRAGGLEHIIDGAPEHDLLEAEANRHRALADPIRLRIIHALAQCDLCPCLLKEITNLPDSKLSYHLNVLEEAKMITSFPQKRWRIYTLTELGRASVR